MLTSLALLRYITPIDLLAPYFGSNPSGIDVPCGL